MSPAEGSAKPGTVHVALVEKLLGNFGHGPGLAVVPARPWAKLSTATNACRATPAWRVSWQLATVVSHVATASAAARRVPTRDRVVRSNTCRTIGALAAIEKSVAGGIASRQIPRTCRARKARVQVCQT